MVIIMAEDVWMNDYVKLRPKPNPDRPSGVWCLFQVYDTLTLETCCLCIIARDRQQQLSQQRSAAQNTLTTDSFRSTQLDSTHLLRHRSFAIYITGHQQTQIGLQHLCQTLQFSSPKENADPQKFHEHIQFLAMSMTNIGYTSWGP